MDVHMHIATSFGQAPRSLFAAVAAGAGNEAPLRVLDTVPNRVAPLLEWLRDHGGSWLDYRLLGAELWRYMFLLIMLLIFVLLANLVRYAFEHHQLRLPKRARWPGDEELLHLSGRPAAAAIVAVGIYVGMAPLVLNWLPAAAPFLGRATGAVVAGCLVWFLYRGIAVLDAHLRKLAERTDNQLDNAFVDILRKTLRIVILIIGSLFILQAIFELRVTALLASAGIVGLAFAFAAQDTIANIFGTIMLLTDQPFKLGERIVVEGADGTVEAIGFRSTWVRTLDGHLVSLPNKQVANTKIQNIGRRPFIKRVSTISITYDTPPEKVELAVQMLREILDNHEGMPAEFPPQVYFTEFASYSLDILLIAWYEPPDYWAYMAWCEKTNHEILRRFNSEGIEFAFPTSTTYLAEDPKRHLGIATRTEWVASADS